VPESGSRTLDETKIWHLPEARIYKARSGFREKLAVTRYKFGEIISGIVETRIEADDHRVLPEILSEVPGKKSLEWARRLSEVECRNTTYLGDDWPIFWKKAEGVNVWDVDGNRFLDMTSGFGVAGLGYGFTGDALREQSASLVHAMGDVHPARVKVELCEALSEITFEKWVGEKGKCLFGNSGFEAVEAALKTAVIATRRSGILSFEGGYHGLGYGALLGQGIDWFREPFEGQMAKVTQRLSFPRTEEELDKFTDELWKLDGLAIGAVLVEPIQGRGGIVVPPKGFLKILREWCDTVGAILIFDEIYTGFWRTGKMFACEWEGVVPDLICLGKALSGGFPISVCVGRAEVMDAWPPSEGEALHTSTFLGNPMGCAMAIEAIRRYREPRTESVVEAAATNLQEALAGLGTLNCVKEIRGRGLMMGVETDSGDRVLEAVKGLLRDGVIALPDGPIGDVVAMTPPLSISREEVEFAIRRLREHLG
jgi:4-aminobutyrate aminotransferase-like enzyme|tara:strand:+ start:15510 stop:16958 length:1449 start_codon:yes stop_codon:yes gene_type:complete